MLGVAQIAYAFQAGVEEEEVEPGAGAKGVAVEEGFDFLKIPELEGAGGTGGNRRCKPGLNALPRLAGICRFRPLTAAHSGQIVSIQLCLIKNREDQNHLLLGHTLTLTREILLSSGC